MNVTFFRIPLPSTLRFKVMSFFWHTQAFRFKLMKVLTIVMMSTTLYMLAFRRSVPSTAEMGVNLNDPKVPSNTANNPRETFDYWQSLDKFKKYEFASLDNFFPDKIFFDRFTKEVLTGYLKALRHGIKIVDCLPRHLTIDVINRCRSIGKPPLLQHQHALEIVFPKMLREMSDFAKRRGNLQVPSEEADFDPIYPSIHPDSLQAQTHAQSLSPANESTSSWTKTGLPLFHYVEAYPYHAVYCTDKSNNKDPFSSREDWTQRDPYWLSAAQHLVEMPQWSVNMGLDFIAPASHPQLKPSRRHPYLNNYLQRLSFLSTDMDVSGSAPKDIVVPYLAENVPMLLMPKKGGSSPPAVQLLLYFAGGDNPKLGLRTKLAASFAALDKDDAAGVSYSLDKSGRNAEGYLGQMSLSQFCLIVRGDTSSSRRLFTAIAVGCIPVIVSDWIDLPFARIIDYSRFTLQFPEAVADSVLLLQGMVRNLRKISVTQLADMRNALSQAKRVLLFDHLEAAESSFNTRTNDARVSPVSNTATTSVINPVSLTFIEALLVRIDLCAKQSLIKAPMCKEIDRRLSKTT